MLSNCPAGGPATTKDAALAQSRYHGDSVQAAAMRKILPSAGCRWWQTASPGPRLAPALAPCSRGLVSVSRLQAGVSLDCGFLVLGILIPISVCKSIYDVCYVARVNKLLLQIRHSNIEIRKQTAAQ